MTVQELRDMLEDLNGDDEIRLAYQPSWPLAAHVAGVADDLEPGVVWLVAGEAPDDSPYAPRAAFTEAVR